MAPTLPVESLVPIVVRPRELTVYKDSIPAKFGHGQRTSSVFHLFASENDRKSNLNLLSLHGHLCDQDPYGWHNVRVKVTIFQRSFYFWTLSSIAT